MHVYREHALDGASALDLVVALYDGIMRFLYSAAEAVDRGDRSARRIAAGRALDIIVHLQARLRMDIGGEPAQVLSEFYASIFAQILQASQEASRPKFEHAIACVRNVREAWKQVAVDFNLNSDFKDHASLLRSALTPLRRNADPNDTEVARWTA